ARTKRRRAAALQGLFAAAVARAGSFGFSILLAQDCLPREFDLITLATDALNQNLLSFLQFVANVLDAAIGYLGNVQQAISTRKDLNKCAEVDNPIHGAKISLAHLRLGSQATNTIYCRIRCFTTRSRDRDGAVIRHVDLCTRLFDERS